MAKKPKKPDPKTAQLFIAALRNVRPETKMVAMVACIDGEPKTAEEMAALLGRGGGAGLGRARQGLRDAVRKGLLAEVEPGVWAPNEKNVRLYGKKPPKPKAPPPAKAAEEEEKEDAPETIAPAEAPQAKESEPVRVVAGATVRGGSGAE